MTGDDTDRPTCVVCRRRIAAKESYLIRLRDGQRSAMHKHLCFPPRARKRGFDLPRAA